MKTIILTGGTGAVGSKLSMQLAEKGNKIIILTRKKNNSPLHANCTFSYWNPGEGEIDIDIFLKADCIIHLAGANIAEKKWTDERKRIILNSRLDSLRTIAKALKTVNKKPDIIMASAIGYYGYDQPAKVFQEDDSSGKGFLAEVCIQHEALAKELFSNNRLVILRTGVVLNKEAGFYKEVARSLKFRVAVIFGKGQQIVSWIHVDDLCNAYQFATENNQLSGIFNACAPHPASLKEITLAMAQSRCGKPFLTFRIPPVLLKAGLGQLAEEALLGTADVSAQKLMDTGFSFQYPNLDDAIGNLQ